MAEKNLAPTDPEKARPFFYIMKNKEIFLQGQPDGLGKAFIYEDSGRLIASAKITGSIEDDEILKLLETTSGFRTLVHSIGISMECDDPMLMGRFVFQMYGEKDLYGGGSNLISEQICDGMEHRILLSEIPWTADEKEPGQIRFEFPRTDFFAKVSVRLYLNDGFTAPEYVEETAVDLSTKEYRDMIARSLVQTGNLTRVKRAIKKARDGEDVTIAFIGGSITQGAGATPINTECYAYKAYRYFADTFGTRGNVHFVKAGIGGTPSELGVIRFERDVLRYGAVDLPDLVVVEFAVNDDNDETEGDCYESLVRKILKLQNDAGVILLFSVFADDFNLQERLAPVGVKLQLPMVSVRDAVVPQFYDSSIRVLSKNQFFYDIFHPTSLGHTIMADGLKLLFDVAERELSKSGLGEDTTAELLALPPAIGKTYEQVVLFDKKDSFAKAAVDAGSFTGTDTDLQSVELDMNLAGTSMLPYNWMYDGQSDAKEPCFTLTVTAKALIIIFKDSGEVNVGRADAYVDGSFVRELDPHFNNWTHCNPVILFSEKECAEHTVRIQIREEDLDKRFTILGFGIVA